MAGFFLRNHHIELGLYFAKNAKTLAGTIQAQTAAAKRGEGDSQSVLLHWAEVVGLGGSGGIWRDLDISWSRMLKTTPFR